MNIVEFQSRLQENSRPFILDLWAPWCGPCRSMEPAVRQMKLKYQDQVDVLQINADDSPEILQALGVMSIPTFIGFAGGKEVLRRTGTLSGEGLDTFFDATLHERKTEILPPAPIDRIIRSGAGVALIALGLSSGPSILWMGLGAVLLFSAFYDRCPIYRALAPRIKSLFTRSPKEALRPADSKENQV